MSDVKNTVIQGMWIGEGLTTMERLSIASFLSNGHSYKLYVYRELQHVPQGTTICDANEILPESEIFQYGETGTYAVFADLFRYKLLLERGGWWSDLDVICIKPFDFPTSYVFATEPDFRSRAFVTNGIMKAPAGSDVLGQAVRFCESQDLKKLPWSATGPDLLHRLVSHSVLAEYCHDPATFCPVSPMRWMSLLLPDATQDIKPHTCAVHLWHELWRRYPLDTDAQYAPLSLYEQLKKRYLG
jgi:mannosyltransferase OCH1-like enzyme